MTRHRSELTPPGLNEAETIAELAADAYERSEAIEPTFGEIRSFIVGRDEQRITDSFERFLSKPSRQRGRTHVRDVASFVTLVKRVADPDSTVIFANEVENVVTAVANYDEGWGDHRLVLNLTLSPEWEHWRSMDNKLVTQVQFAEHIEDGLSAIVSPPAADLMELAQTFHAKRELNFESGQRLSSGDVKFRYHEETKAGAGQKGELEVPEKFELALPVYRGGANFPITARLRYRITANGLGLGYKLDRPDELLDAAFTEVTGNLRGELDSFTILSGAASSAVTEL